MIVIRNATALDAHAMGALYVRVWQDTYPSLIPNDVLLAMCPERAGERWERSIRGNTARRGAVVAEDPAFGLAGLGSYGPNRDQDLRFAGEIFTLYVDSDAQGQGTGTALLGTMFQGLAESGAHSALVWTMALNQNRFFYEAVGGRVVARKMGRIGGMPVALQAYGWDDLPTWIDQMDGATGTAQIAPLSVRMAADHKAGKPPGDGAGEVPGTAREA